MSRYVDIEPYEDPYVFMSYEAAEAELERRRKREAGKQQLNEREEDKS